MGKIQIRMADEELANIKMCAKRNDCSVAEYSRRRLRAGMLLWDVGNFDKELLNALLEEGFDHTGVNDTTNISKDAAAEIHRNLSTTDPTPLKDSSRDDLVDLIIEEIVKEALTNLQRTNDVEHVPGEGYVKI